MPTWALHTDLTLDEVNVHLLALQQAGLLGAVEQDGSTTLYLPRRREDLPLAGRWKEIADQDWNQAWKAGIEPVVVSNVAVVAPWLPPPPDPAVILVIEPAQAFGTGHHETTTSCLAALQDVALQGASVFDVGTGTGVLALAAKALGADRVLASDIDPLAVAAAAENARSNGLNVEVVAGSVDAAGTELFDVVVANLDTTTLSRLAADLVARVAPGGILIVSGVSNERNAQARGALEAAGADVRVSNGAEWSLLTATRPR